jgi:hypothetical protein
VHLALVSALFLCGPRSVRADANDDRRAEMGVRLFRAMLAADRDLSQKKEADGRLLVLFLYADDRKHAEDLQKAFAKAGDSGNPEPIREIPVRVGTATAESLLASRAPAGIFVTQPLDSGKLKATVQFGIANHVIVFSPFEGHVEMGVLGGLVVEAQVRPFVNKRTLSASGINLKDFFLTIAKVHE